MIKAAPRYMGFKIQKLPKPKSGDRLSSDELAKQVLKLVDRGDEYDEISINSWYCGEFTVIPLTYKRDGKEYTLYLAALKDFGVQLFDTNPDTYSVTHIHTCLTAFRDLTFEQAAEIVRRIANSQQDWAFKAIEGLTESHKKELLAIKADVVPDEIKPKEQK